MGPGVEADDVLDDVVPEAEVVVDGDDGVDGESVVSFPTPAVSLAQPTKPWDVASATKATATPQLRERACLTIDLAIDRS